MVFVQSKFQQKQPNWIELYTILQIFCEAIFSKWRGWKLNRLMASRGQQKWGSNLPSWYFWARAGFISKDKTRARRSSYERETGPSPGARGEQISFVWVRAVIPSYSHYCGFILLFLANCSGHGLVNGQVVSGASEYTYIHREGGNAIRYIQLKMLIN